jgi:hypothetical protein
MGALAASRPHSYSHFVFFGTYMPPRSLLLSSLNTATPSFTTKKKSLHNASSAMCDFGQLHEVSGDTPPTQLLSLLSLLLSSPPPLTRRHHPPSVYLVWPATLASSSLSSLNCSFASPSSSFSVCDLHGKAVAFQLLQSYWPHLNMEHPPSLSSLLTLSLSEFSLLVHEVSLRS